jgi:hypothetical protein
VWNVIYNPYYVLSEGMWPVGSEGEQLLEAAVTDAGRMEAWLLALPVWLTRVMTTLSVNPLKPSAVELIL